MTYHFVTQLEQGQAYEQWLDARFADTYIIQPATPQQQHQCPGGHTCACAAGSHTMHICSSERCQCHSQARYDPPGAAAALAQTIIARRNGRK